MLDDEDAEPKALPFALLDEITNSFSKELEIGRGGFAVVYRGIVGTGTVAVKKLSSACIHETEFQREVECLINARHRNIVRFLGYCADTQGTMQRFNRRFVMADLQQRLLCFEYVPNGSLCDLITDPPAPPCRAAGGGEGATAADGRDPALAAAPRRRGRTEMVSLLVHVIADTTQVHLATVAVAMPVAGGRRGASEGGSRTLSFICVGRGGRARKKRNRYRIIKGVCEGLNYLHKNRIVHLDLKPANILIDDNMEPKIADFGLSRCFDEGESMVMRTKVAGTLGYMPPEYDSRAVTRLFDIYSLGVIILEIMTGRRGYHAIEDVLESWRNRLEETPEDTELEQIRVCANIGKECTKNNPEKRPRSTQDIIDRLNKTESDDESSVEQVYKNHKIM
ncbi:hypothetical protein U9M48_004481 [Paspalum notatum var. saurae]|uniref:non-specific serine/threonine protein kinase n=1 Tax=Paspalum notatum var. saurae TaxID=547442 RepID=A0AAQ3SEV4_PASNO